jgi:PST family polysaccharide transporter
MRFGSTVTLNSLVTYLAFNADKVLLGRLMGAETLGVYGRAYQLINLPTDQLNSAIGWVAFPALSRLQDDPSRFRMYFLKGYSMVLALTIPITFICALFAEDIIFVLLGPRWKDAAHIFRLLAPTVLAFALINPFGWLLYSSGKVRQSLNMSLVLAPIVIVGYLIGLRYGAGGVALGFSAAMTLMIGPMIAWGKHGTQISSRDIFQAAKPAFFSGIVAATITFVIQSYILQITYPMTRLLFGCGILICSYLLMLLYVMGQKEVYLDLLRLIRPSSEEKGALAQR